MNNLKPVIVEFKTSEKYLRLFSPDTQTAGIKAGFVNLKPGEEIGEHSTENKEEVIIVLSGQLNFFYEQETQPVEVGANFAIYVPPQTKHNIENTGSNHASYVFITKA